MKTVARLADKSRRVANELYEFAKAVVVLAAIGWVCYYIAFPLLVSLF